LPQESVEKPKTGRLCSKTGRLYRARQPLTPPDAFRAFHWLATLSFITTEKRHEGSISSYLRGYWFNFNSYTWEETLVKGAGSKAVGIGFSIASFGVITAVGTVVGGPIGALIGAAIGAVFGATSAVASLAVGAIVDLSYHKLTREDIDDRLTRKDWQERYPEDDQDKKPKGHLFTVRQPMSLSQIADQFDMPVEKIWDHPRNELLQLFVEEECDATPPTDFLLPENEIIYIPAKPVKEPEAHDFRYDSRRLTKLVQHTLRDSVVHLRKAVAIYQQMPERMLGGRTYVPGEKETFETVLENVRKQYPHFKFREEEVLYHPRNPGTLSIRPVKPGETLAQIADAEGVAWHEILEWEDNHDLRFFYMRKRLWPEKEKNRHVVLENVRQVWIPRGLIKKPMSWKHRMYEYDGELEIKDEYAYNYVEPGKPIWIPAADTLADSNFKSCEAMIRDVQIALEFRHHLNKYRNYLLPAMNLCRLYLDVYEEFAAIQEKAQAMIEEAVLEYQQYAEHRDCNMWAQWRNLLDRYDMAERNDWRDWRFWLFGPRYGGPNYTCMRKALKAALKQAGKGEEYTVQSGESFDSIAENFDIPVQALVAHNFRELKIDRNQARWDPEKQEWEIREAVLPEGTVLLIPGKNVIDKIVYAKFWEKLGITQDRSGSRHGDYSDNYTAKVSIVEVEIDDLKKELDKAIDEYLKALEKNRETHQKHWHEAPPELRRYFYMTQDILHGLDMPGAGVRISHRYANLDMRYTVGEKALAAINHAVGAINHIFNSALSMGTAYGAEFIPEVGAMDALKDFFMGGTGKAMGNYVAKKAATSGSSTAADITEGIIGFVIGKVTGKASDKDTKSKVTEAHRLNFLKERVAVANQLTGSHKKDPQLKSLKHAAKEVDELFLKISRHAHWAYSHYQKDLSRKLDALDKNKDKTGCGLTGCRDCVLHFDSLYEYQHQVDKMERYLTASLALIKGLFDFDRFLDGIEKELEQTLEKSAGEFIAHGDHSQCRNIVWSKLRKGYCYGPSEKNPGRPRNPLRSRPAWDKPERPSKEGRPPKSELESGD